MLKMILLPTALMVGKLTGFVLNIAMLVVTVITSYSIHYTKLYESRLSYLLTQLTERIPAGTSVPK